ncbi:cell wall-active antibiotics response protein LiaF [Litchfieldia alkalitelluris]|uniref:cell wall-active antibiotics response protein LiaF n=1 Tax=Litchfieldia alkalitelluris TaxID=304268 RepID=UPI001474F041|nr:cell wall-active antibiotics response protein LiaF [Litchfieldia alkalitelluris]
MKEKTIGRIVAAIILIVFGTLLLLVNINVISLEINNIFVTFYPIIFILFGLKWMTEGLITKGKDWFFGFFLLLFGTLLMLDRLQIIHFTFLMFWRLWPLFIIYYGLKLFSKNRLEDNRKKNSVPIGSLNFDKEDWSVESMDVWTGIGDVRFDFSKAYIPDKDTKIKVGGLIGDVKMLIPEDVPFSVESYVKVGSIDILKNNADGHNRVVSYKTPNFDDATRRLSIEISLKIGSIQIDKV